MSGPVEQRTAAGRLFGKIAVITGTAGGMGRAAALRFAAEGAVVVGADLNAEQNTETAEAVAARGGRMIDVAPVDLANPRDVDRLVAAAGDEFRRIDVLFNNASAPRFAPLDEMTLDDWQFTMRNELDLVYLACRAAWPLLRAARIASVINTASAVALVGIDGLGSTAHSATKGGVVAMTRQLAAEGAPHGIRVNALSPGVIDTPGTASQLADPVIRASLESLPMLPRIGTADEVAAAALFLASDESSYVTGTNLVVDGGWTAR